LKGGVQCKKLYNDFVLTFFMVGPDRKDLKFELLLGFSTSQEATW